MIKRKVQSIVALLFVCTSLMTINLSAHTHRCQNEEALAKSDEQRSVLKNWLFLCAPCHSVKGTGTDFGPPLVGPEVRKKYSAKQLEAIFADPEGHGLSEALPAFRQLKAKERVEMANWLASIKEPDDIKIETNTLKPPPFLYVQNCAGCHAPDATGGLCSNLHNIGKRWTRDALIELIEDPRRAGLKTDVMPSFPELSPEERKEIADWLVTLE